MRRQTATVVSAAALGIGAAIGVAACGEDRKGDVQFEDGTGTERTGTDATGTGTETSGETAPETTGTETTP